MPNGFLEARNNSGLTQVQVAEALSVSQGAVSQWEVGETSPRASLLVRLAQLYNCSIDDLLGREVSKTT